MGWATQLLVRTQQEIPEEWGGPLTPEELRQPWFQVANLSTFSPHQVVDWDETHQDLVMLGGSGRSVRGSEYKVRFHRMPSGAIDPTGGKQEGSTLAWRKSCLSVKYEKHIRFLLGTASVLLTNGTVEGRRAEAMEYTDRWVCTHRDYLVHRRTEMARVRALPGDGTPWVSGHRSKDDVIFEEDDVTQLAVSSPIPSSWETSSSSKMPSSFERCPETHGAPSPGSARTRAILVRRCTK